MIDFSHGLPYYNRRSKVAKKALIAPQSWDTRTLTSFRLDMARTEHQQLQKSRRIKHETE